MSILIFLRCFCLRYVFPRYFLSEKRAFKRVFLVDCFPLLLRASTVFLGLRLTCNNSATRLAATTNTITLYIILFHVRIYNIFSCLSVEIFLPCSTRPSHRRRAPHVLLPSHTWPWEENVIDFFSPFSSQSKNIPDWLCATEKHALVVVIL